jgi:hypothetical protein
MTCVKVGPGYFELLCSPEQEKLLAAMQFIANGPHQSGRSHALAMLHLMTAFNYRGMRIRLWDHFPYTVGRVMLMAQINDLFSEWCRQNPKIAYKFAFRRSEDSFAIEELEVQKDRLGEEVHNG